MYASHLTRSSGVSAAGSRSARARNAANSLSRNACSSSRMLFCTIELNDAARIEVVFWIICLAR